jgi:choline dehydrogenase
MPKREWDYIVAGGGTAGCVLAARLTERPGTSVLLLEAGSEYPSILKIPLVGMQQTTAYSWKYFTAQQTGLGERQISYPFGKVLGGSSSTNAMMYYRGTRGAYDRWEQLGNPGWSFDEVLPYFRKSEHYHDGASDHHGGDGPIHVSQPRHKAALSEAFIEACLEQGWPHNPDFNGPDETGAGYFSVMQRRGRRSGSAEAYLQPVRSRPGLTVKTGALVRRVLLKGNRATGVECTNRNGEIETAEASGEVILSTGALNSPHLLMLSGIGPAERLRRIGIEPRIDLAGVGESLRDHLRVPVLYESGRRSPGHMLNWVPAGFDYLLRKRGVLASNCCEAGAVLRASPEADMPDLQFVTHFQTSLYPGTVDLQFCLLRCESRGRVSAVSADPSVPPSIDPNYFSERCDIDLAIRGVRLARQVASAPALRRFPLGKEILPGPDLVTDRQLEAYCRSVAETCYHPVGTCRMGTDPMAVVDAELRVRGTERLRVVDASVMPDLPNANTCAVVLMIAERAAALLAADNDSSSSLHALANRESLYPLTAKNRM